MRIIVFVGSSVEDNEKDVSLSDNGEFGQCMFGNGVFQFLGEFGRGIWFFILRKGGCVEFGVLLGDFREVG